MNPSKNLYQAQTLAQSIPPMHWINGEWQAPISEKTFPVLYPANLKTIAHAAQGTQADVNNAVLAAKIAQATWAKVPARQRGKYLIEAAEHLEKNTEDLALLMSLETGKAIRTESRGEAQVFADLFRYYGGLASELKGETLPFHPNIFACSVREPIGVIGAIVAWNVPLLLMALKVAPALAAGNSIVVKPSEEAPLSLLYVASLLKDIFPKGILNIVSGDGPLCGTALIEHPLVGKIAFTGSVETGRLVYQKAASKLIPVSLELGGKSPMLIMPDADLAQVIEGAITGMRFTRQGQSCTAASRIFVHKSLYIDFIQGIKNQLDKKVIGDPLDELTDIGSLISMKQYKRVLAFITEASLGENTTVLRASQLPKESSLQKGPFLQPTLLTGLPLNARALHEEIFGPVSCIIPWDNYDDMMAAANDSPYGLAATLWTKDLKQALISAQRLEVGLVQINQNLVVQPNLAFGGYKSSGLGKEGSLGAMLEHYTRQKTILMNIE